MKDSGTQRVMRVMHCCKKISMKHTIKHRIPVTSVHVGLIADVTHQSQKLQRVLVKVSFKKKEEEKEY